MCRIFIVIRARIKKQERSDVWILRTKIRHSYILTKETQKKRGAFPYCERLRYTLCANAQVSAYSWTPSNFCFPCRKGRQMANYGRWKSRLPWFILLKDSELPHIYDRWQIDTVINCWKIIITSYLASWSFASVIMKSMSADGTFTGLRISMSAMESAFVESHFWNTNIFP